MVKDIVVVGGGTAGTVTANKLVTKLYPEISRGKARIRLISNTLWHYYKPAFVYAAFGAPCNDALRRPQAAMLRPEIDFVLDEVMEFEFKDCRLSMLSGETCDYDYLVVATGCIPSPERIDGLKEAGDHFCQYGPAMQLYRKLSSIEKGRILVGITYPETPNLPQQCGIAPIETTLMLDEFLRQRGMRERIELICTYPTVSQRPHNKLLLHGSANEILPMIFDAKDIRYRDGFSLARVDPEKKIAVSTEGPQEDFDILLQTPPIRAVDAVLNSGISKTPNNEGWLPTDRYSLQLKGFDNAFVIGDTVDLPTSKSGDSCYNQAAIICNNIAGLIRIGEPVAVYDGKKEQAIDQGSFGTRVPLWQDYEQELKLKPATSNDDLMCRGLERDTYVPGTAPGQSH